MTFYFPVPIPTTSVCKAWEPTAKDTTEKKIRETIPFFKAPHEAFRSLYDDSQREVLYDVKFDSITEVNPHHQMFTASAIATLYWQISKADAVAYGESQLVLLMPLSLTLLVLCDRNVIFNHVFLPSSLCLYSRDIDIQEGHVGARVEATKAQGHKHLWRQSLWQLAPLQESLARRDGCRRGSVHCLRSHEVQGTRWQIHGQCDRDHQWSIL